MSEADLHFERVDAIRLIGLPVIDGEENPLGTVSDVSATERGCVTGLHVRLRWLACERCLAPDRSDLKVDAVIVKDGRDALASCPEPPEGVGLLGVQVCSAAGDVLGKIVNVLVQPSSLSLVGLELSHGRVRDWVQGRPIVILHPEDHLGTLDGRYITLPEEVRTVGAEGHEGDPPPSSTSMPPIDWDEVRRTPVEEIVGRMARVVWERRGAPKEGHGEDDWREYVRPWARALKAAAGNGDSAGQGTAGGDEDPSGKQGDAPKQSDARKQLDDVALMSSDEVEAVRVFRKGVEPFDRGGASTAPETGSAMAA